MNARKLLSLLLLSFSVVSVLAQDAKVGETVSGRLSIGKRDFALPPGKWVVVADTTSRNTIDSGSLGANAKQQFLVQLDDNNRFVAGIFVRASLASVAVAGWNDSTCDRKDTLHRDILKGSFRFPECLLINHVTNFWAGDVPTADFERNVWNWFREKKVQLPYTAISSIYVNYFAGDAVRMSIQTNPELNGLVDTDRKPWGQSPWHVALIASDSKRQTYISDLKKWNEAMVRNVASTLWDLKPLDRELPPLPIAPTH